jgi:hypothetical protein
MIIWIAYHSNGRIHASGNGLESELALQSKGFGLPVMSVDANTQVNDLSQYIDLTDPSNPALANRVDFPAAWDGTNITLPTNCQLEVRGPVESSLADIEAGTHEITFDEPGVYQLEFSSIEGKYLPFTLEITA